MRDTMRRRGLAGQRLGKHIVPEGDVAVQLGEDLSESLRGIKVCWMSFADIAPPSKHITLA